MATIFHRSWYDQRIGRITVLIHPLDVPLNRNARDIIVTRREVNEVLTLQDGLRVVIIDGYHRYKAICEL